MPSIRPIPATLSPRAAAYPSRSPAYILQLSIIGETRTVALLDGLGDQSRVADFGFFESRGIFADKQQQIERVEASSDAYHLSLGEDVMVAYLLEVTRKRG